MMKRCPAPLRRSCRLLHRGMMSEAQATAFQTSPIELEKLDAFLYRSRTLWKPPGARAVYGGQVVGQALSASRESLTDDKDLHSLHSYFLKGGDPSTPILYRVRRLSVTNNFEMHHISGTQQGQIIFSLSASYHRKEESELFHERPMPDAPDPNTLPSQEDRLKELVDDPKLSERIKYHINERLKTPFPIDVREVDPVDFFNPEPRPPRKLLWMRARVPLTDADLNMHRCLAAFASDWGLASASLLPHGISFGSPNLKLITSLDHAMWFHAPFRADEWLLFDMKSVKMAGGRGMNMGYLYNSSGELAITTTQEALIRLRGKDKPPTSETAS